MKRLVLAASASLACFIATMIFNVMTKNTFNHDDSRSPVARLTKLVREASSRASDDVIWHNVEVNEDLYSGDYVRTAGESAATIEFIKGKAQLNVDQNSVILIEDSDGNPGVNFIDGSLIVGASEAGKSISVKAGGEKINLSDSSISLNKGKKGDIDLALVSGTLDNLKQNNDSKILNSLESKIHVLEPTPNQTLLRTETDSTLVIFKLAPEEAMKSPVTLMMGESPDSLKNIISKNTNSEFIRVPVSTGVHFWKLVSGDRESSVNKIKVLTLSAARPLSPANQTKVVENQKGNIAFSWAVDPNWMHVELEISDDPQFKRSLSRTDVSGHDSIEMVLNPEQRLFWRINSYLDSARGASSEIYSMSIGRKIQENLSLDLIRPYEKENFKASMVEASGLNLSWKALEAESHYLVSLKNLGDGNVQSFKAETNHWRISTLPTGKYQWSVTALDAQEKELTHSAVRSFEVEQLAPISFKNLRNEVYYSTERPVLGLDWENGTSEAKEWHIKISLSQDSNKKEGGALDVMNVSTANPTLVKTLPFPGRYQIEIEAVNQNGEIVAKSERASVVFKQAPLIPAPVFESRVPASIHADNRGAFELSWKSVRDAQEYVVRLKNESGTVVESLRPQGTSAQFKKLHPGSYVVTVRAIDTDGHEGLESSAKPVYVDQLSFVEPPKNRKVSFDDE